MKSRLLNTGNKFRILVSSWHSKRGQKFKEIKKPTKKRRRNKTPTDLGAGLLLPHS